MKKIAILALLVMALATFVGGAAFAFDQEMYAGEKELWEMAKQEKGLSSYDTGPTWANWKGLFDGFAARYGIKLVYNDLGSGATVVRLEKELNNPQADTAYYFMPFGALAKERGVTQAYKPVNFDKIPEILRDPEGNWFSIHKGTVVFVVNKRLVKEAPTSWKALLDPKFKKSIVYLDPRTAGIGYAIVIATAYSHGGSIENLDPGIDYLAELQKSNNVRMIEKTTPFDKFIKGEIPVWITYDWNGYRAKYIAGLGDDVEIVIPEEGTITSPYAISMAKGAPNPNSAKLWLNYILSDEGQQTFAKGYVRPIRDDVELPAEVVDKFLPASEYEKAKNVDWVAAQKVQKEAAQKWGSKVLGEN
ncbi:MAG: extracellular solute-binding protein [Aminobacterium sp.]|jgi:putative spermidine/putrescine transport system substrate-binding protein|uniref:extracellular solute-binding protein n=1 Tax=unclassified Aminobacterium TaxID=2685012 RepID=UPI001BD0CB2C|nr:MULTISPECIES: extracellular solute-binding protein [unclassified Aminobacterium]MDD2206867.1 extracellular solute-binding protein [Aminobacterium sp.]MDD3425413.1 extracellular solute-binding protein [Aminobacterium sp.]MDD3707891.1 extracellular solute-binding protein [Aminobacterium sp.]MDD4229502.1 extracellular solute-binding protein [Aminobacterium sp.]MDD4551012.1 extracellular solute-binding protein [Aminobacterium sp.]